MSETETTRQIDTEARPATIDEAITKYSPALKKLAYKLCNGDYYRSTLLFSDTVIHCLENWHTFRAEGGVYEWMKWRMRGVHSHNARKYKLREAVDLSSAVSIDADAEGGGIELACASLHSQPNQEHRVELNMMLDRLKGVAHAGEFISHALGYSYEELGAERGISSQAIHQRTVIARGIAKKGL